MAPVKADTARLTLNVDTMLWQMPEGVQYVAQSGRATVKAGVKKDTSGRVKAIVIESSCDSLARLCAVYESENARLSQINAHLWSDSIMTHDEMSTLKKNVRDGPCEGWIVVVMILIIVAGLLWIDKHKEEKEE